MVLNPDTPDFKVTPYQGFLNIVPLPCHLSPILETGSDANIRVTPQGVMMRLPQAAWSVQEDHGRHSESQNRRVARKFRDYSVQLV